MKKILFVVLFFVFCSSLGFADGNLTISKSTLTTPSYINTRTPTALFNLTLNATLGEVNITAILINLTGDASYQNVSSVIVYNDSNADGSIVGEAILGINSSLSANFANITFSNNLTVSVDSERSIIIAINLSSDAQPGLKIGLNITSNESIVTALNDNITITNGYADSGIAQIQDVHASASISPHYVDTNIINQTLVYTINVTGKNSIQNISIYVPANYSIVQLVSVKDGDSVLSEGYYTHTISDNMVNISLKVPPNVLQINFTVNTSSNPVPSLSFNSTITGSNITNAATDVTNDATNVTTQQLVKVESVSVYKGTAIVNGTDYWLFNFTINITANVSGLLQFKMNNWNCSEGYILNLTNQTNVQANNTIFYAWIWESGNQANNQSVFNHYNLTNGVSLSAAANQLKYLTLRMVIPLGTPISSSWWTTYWMVFRVTP